MDLAEIKKPNILTLNEASNFMGISYMVIYRLVKNGKIKALNIAKTGERPIFGITPQSIQAYYDSFYDTIAVRPEKKEGDAEPENIHQ